MELGREAGKGIQTVKAGIHNVTSVGGTRLK